MITAKNFKQQAHELVDQLPDNATWPDLIDCAAERQDLEIAQFYSEYESTYSPEEAHVADDATLDYDTLQPSPFDERDPEASDL